jgi:hypothetical protein
MKRSRSASPTHSDSADNLTQISQGVMDESKSVIDTTKDEEDLDEHEIFRRITRPPDIPGLKNWGIPDEVDPDSASATLKVRCLFR